MGSKTGVLKIAAKRAGLVFEEYMRLIESGQKRCTKCKDWKPESAFGKDSSRTSGYGAVCAECRFDSPERHTAATERKANKTQGLSWCRGCQAWLTTDIVKRGACRSCHAAEARAKYAVDTAYRHERQQHAHSRKRSVAPVPHEVAQSLLIDFDHKCAYCCVNPATTWDHIIPVQNQGETRNGNIIPCCVSCNSSKKTNDVYEWIAKKGHKPNPKICDILILAEVLH